MLKYVRSFIVGERGNNVHMSNNAINKCGQQAHAPSPTRNAFTGKVKQCLLDEPCKEFELTNQQSSNRL